MIRTTLNGVTLRLFNTESDARAAADLFAATVDEVREVAGGWLYRSGEKWVDTDGVIREVLFPVQVPDVPDLLELTGAAPNSVRRMVRIILDGHISFGRVISGPGALEDALVNGFENHEPDAEKALAKSKAKLAEVLAGIG
jgi:hypothetical protein